MLCAESSYSYSWSWVSLPEGKDMMGGENSKSVQISEVKSITYYHCSFTQHTTLMHGTMKTLSDIN